MPQNEEDEEKQGGIIPNKPKCNCCCDCCDKDGGGDNNNGDNAKITGNNDKDTEAPKTYFDQPNTIDGGGGDIPKVGDFVPSINGLKSCQTGERFNIRLNENGKPEDIEAGLCGENNPNNTPQKYVYEWGAKVYVLVTPYKGKLIAQGGGYARTLKEAKSNVWAIMRGYKQSAELLRSIMNLTDNEKGASVIGQLTKTGVQSTGDHNGSALLIRYECESYRDSEMPAICKMPATAGVGNNSVKEVIFKDGSFSLACGGNNATLGDNLKSLSLCDDQGNPVNIKANPFGGWEVETKTEIIHVGWNNVVFKVEKKGS